MKEKKACSYLFMHRPKVVKNEIIYLTQTEIKHLEEKRMPNKRLEEVRD